ncbi:MAG: hypothetical protein EPN93_03455 [Spirochaetes bacterium]|nr:MAG: hypothetical protein EPN93_03455 [Spirochaetota bacterium]
MTVLDKLASAQGRRDDEPNRELARAIAAKKDARAVAELAENLSNPEKSIRGDCIKTLYEIGYVAPALIASHADAFIALLDSGDNRMVWGAMIALSTFAGIRASDLFKASERIVQAMEKGSVITVDAGVKVLAGVAAADVRSGARVFPLLLTHLANCRPKEVGQHAETVLVAVNAKNKKAFIETLEARIEHLSAAQKARVAKVIKKAQAR